MTPDAPRQIPVYVVLSPQALMLDLAGPLDVLRYANIVQERVHFDVCYVGPADSVLTSVGLTLSGIEPLPLALPDDALVVLVGDVDDVLPASRNMPRDEMLAQQDAIVEWLKGTTLRPILSALGSADAAELLNALSARVSQVYRSGSAGVVFPFRRLFFIAERL